MVNCFEYLEFNMADMDCTIQSGYTSSIALNTTPKYSKYKKMVSKLYIPITYSKGAQLHVSILSK